jgi:coproporphyrinogen III oxidase-like Fe-S oxidoreductase
MLSARVSAIAMRVASNRSMRLMHAGTDFRLPPANPARQYMLYVHVPFCPTLCPFCSFHRVELREDKARRYFPCLHRQIEDYARAGFRISGVYVGGGTPTAAPAALRDTLHLIRDRFGHVPVSIETNPSDLVPGVLEGLREAGVTRLSVGVQSFDDQLLERMGRLDRYGNSATIRERLRDVSGLFPTLNVDMIFNLPDQDAASLQRDLDIVSQEPGIDQVSFYPLMSTKSTRRAMHARMGGREGDREGHYYEMIRTHLGGTHEMSSAWCFSRRGGTIDEYIVTDDEYIGAGSGAFGYVGGVFYSNTFSLNRYSDLIGAGISPVTMYRKLAEHERMGYDLLVQAFAGAIDLAALERKYGGRFSRTMWKELLYFRTIGAIRRDGDMLRLTHHGAYVWVAMMREFLNGVNRFREQLRANIRNEFGEPGEEEDTVEASA